MTEELIKETKPETITLGDKEYKLSPVNLNVLSGIEEEFDCDIGEIGELLNKKKASALLKLVYILLKDNYPELTKEKIGEMVGMEQLGEVSEALGKALTGE